MPAPTPKSHQSASSFSSRQGSRSGAASSDLDINLPNDEEEGAAFTEGGFASGDDEVEHQAVITQASESSSKFRYKVSSKQISRIILSIYITIY